MRKLYIIIVLAFLLVPTMAASQDNLGTFKLNTCVRLTQICGDCSYNNLTSVIAPNGTLALTPKPMEQNGAEFNYTLCETSDIGTYHVNGVGDLDSTATAWAYDLAITESGHINELTDNILAGILLFVGFMLIIVASVFEMIPLKILSGLGAYLLTLLSLNIISTGTLSKTVASSVGTAFTVVLWSGVFVFIYVGIMLYVSLTKSAQSQGEEEDEESI